MIKKIFAVVLSCVLIIIMWSGENSVQAEAAVIHAASWDGTVDTEWEGKGTKSLPYRIYTPEQFAGMVKSGGGEKAGMYFELMNDIDLGGKPLRANDPKGEWVGQNWKDLKLFDLQSFTGIFNGNGHAITGFYTQKKGGAPLFGFEIAVCGSVSNFMLYGRCEGDGSSIICGSLEGELSDCFNYVNSYDSSASGMVWWADEGAVISRCYNYGEICGSTGIVEILEGNARVEFCANYGTISLGSTWGTGGIVANGRGGTVVNCENFGCIDAPGADSVGGIVGRSSDEGITIEKCSNYGSITGQNHVGGIVGECQRDIDIVNCVNKGSITVKKSSDGYQVGGGISGYNGRDSRSYSIGEFYGNEKTIYGIGGYLVSNSYCVGKNEISKYPDHEKHSKQWSTYPDDEIVDINGGCEYFVINDLSKLQNGFPVLEWEAARFDMDKIISNNITKNKIGIQWPLITRATGYEVYRCVGSETNMKLLAKISDTKYVDSSLTPDTEYKYKVRAYRTENGVTYWGKFSDVLSVATESDKVVMGDVNSDGYVNLEDAQVVLKAALKIDTIQDSQINAADVDKDNYITLADAQLILQIALKILIL